MSIGLTSWFSQVWGTIRGSKGGGGGGGGYRDRFRPKQRKARAEREFYKRTAGRKGQERPLAAEEGNSRISCCLQLLLPRRPDAKGSARVAVYFSFFFLFTSANGAIRHHPCHFPVCVCCLSRSQIVESMLDRPLSNTAQFERFYQSPRDAKNQSMHADDA